MKAAIFGLIMIWGSLASAVTICGALESNDGENYDQLIAQKQIAQDGQPEVILQREQDTYVAFDSGSMMAIGQVMVDENGTSQVVFMAASNGTQVQMLSVPGNVLLFCARQ